MNPSVTHYLADIGVVGVIFRRHQQQHHPVCQLDAIQRHHTHVEEDTKEDGQWDLTQKVTYYNRQAWRETSPESRIIIITIITISLFIFDFINVTLN